MTNDHIVRVNDGKYTFVKRHAEARIDVLRHGDAWVQDLTAANAVASMMAELDAARLVVQAARELADRMEQMPLVDVRKLTAGNEFVGIARAIACHDSLTSDREPPSAWTHFDHTHTVVDPHKPVDQPIEATISRCANGHDVYAVMLNDFRLFGSKCCGSWTVVRRYKTTLAELRDDLAEGVPGLLWIPPEAR